MSEKFDIVVIGAGPGGYVAAVNAAKAGMKTAVVERCEVGGTCLNRGCIPTKAMLHTAHIARESKDFCNIGINAGNNIEVDFNKLHERKSEVVDTLCSGIHQLFKTNKVELFEGSAQIISNNQVTVENDGGQQTLETDKILIAAGSEPFVPKIPGAELPGVVTSDELLGKNAADIKFKRLVIIGGGVIGVEFSDVFSALGCEVTIIEAMPRILPALDREISQNMTMIFKKRGVSVNAGAKVTEIIRDSVSGELTVRYEKNEQISEAKADCVLVSIGRRAALGNLFGQGFELKTERGAVVVDENYTTSEQNIYAIGDVIFGGVQLAHVASSQAENLISVLNGGKIIKDLSIIPSCIYTNPEIASVGLDAETAKERGIQTKTGKALMSANGRSIISSEERGFIKLVFNAETDKIIGAQMMCARATDMIGEFTSAIHSGLTLEQLESAVRAHPTYNEAVGEALAAVK